MAGTATHLHTVPTPAPGCDLTSDLLRAQAAAPTAVRRRGNHPAGRALRAPAAGASVARGRAVEVVGGSTAPTVVPLRPPLAEVVPLRARRAVADRVDGSTATDRVGRAGVRGRADARDGATGPVRLTRRGRRVVAGLGVGAVLALTAVVGGVLLEDAGSPALELAGRSTVTVHSGDTLWSIAETLAPDTDPREVVDALLEANGLSSASLVPGQVLVVP